MCVHLCVCLSVHVCVFSYRCTHPRADDFELDPAYDMGTGTGDVRGSGGRMAGDMSPHGGVGSPGGRVGGVDNTLGSGTGVSDVRDTTVSVLYSAVR